MVARKELGYMDLPYSVGIVVDGLNNLIQTANMGFRFHFYVVGGVVRDSYLGIATGKSDIDIAFAGPYETLIELLTRDKRFSVLKENRNLQTARIAYKPEHDRVQQFEFDLANLRAEDYSPESPYPQVTFDNIPIQWDLARRDFTINAIAFDTKTQEIIDPFDGYSDLSSGTIRVLHDLSFSDDPTRIERGKELAQRLEFTFDSHTAQLMADAGHTGPLEG